MSSLYAKQNLSAQQLQVLQSEMSSKQKSAGMAWALWFFLGYIGGHRFYVGQTGLGVAMLLTAGGLGLWWLLDIFQVNSIVNKTNEQIEAQVLQEIHLYDNAKKNDEAPQLVTA